ncbi:MAG: histidine kinase [Melioribacteraceae bacterium]|nr:histidine kinase [Melioribacteraceae bacterium]
MKNNYIKKFLFIFLLLSSFLFAQEEKIIFERIGKEQGLIPGNVNDIVQDSVGFIWLATENGLCRFDGYNFIYFKNQKDDPTSLSYNHVFSLLLDKNGIIWVGTLGGGLNKFDSKTGKFKRYQYDEKNNSLSNNNIYKIFRDSKNRIWISTLGGGLNIFDPQKESFTHFKNSKNDKNSISSNMVSAIYEDKFNNLWVGTFDNGMNLFNEKENNFTRFIYNPKDKFSLSHNQVMDFLEDEKGNFWIATFGVGINLFDRNYKKFYNIKNDPNFPLKPDNLNIRKLFEDENSFWVATYNGLFKFDKKTFAKTDLYSNPNNQKTINDNKIRSVFKDRTGVIWIGTIVGLNKYDTNKKKFDILLFNQDYQKKIDNKIFVPSEFITEKIIWAGPGKNIISKTRNRKIQIFGSNQNQKQISLNHSINFYLDEKNYLWVGSYNGIHFYEPNKNEFHNVQYFDDGTPTQGNNYIRWFYIDKQKRFWAGTMVGGLNYYDPQKNIYKRFIHNETNLKTLGDNRVSCVLQDKFGKIWIGTFGGLDLLNEADETFTHYRVIYNDTNSISNDRIYAIYESKNGDLWIGTYQGLNKFNREKNNFEQFTTNDGLSDNSIYSIQEDEEGNLWLRTNDGISKFDPKKKIFKNFDINDGIPGLELNGNISIKNYDGKIYFGFANGLIGFYPNQIIENKFKPTVALTKLTIMDEEVIPGENSPINKCINELNEITLSYRDKIIGIEFSALHYAIPSKNKYAYKLEGFLDKWIIVDANNRIAKFSNLDPGKYKLRLKASNNDGIWSDERILSIIITPPYWQTWWFRSLFVVAILFVIFIFYEIRLNKLVDIERTRSKIARNLHDEVGGTLSSIQYFVRAIEKEIQNNDFINTNKYLNLILESSSDAQEKIKDLIWTVNPDEDGLDKFFIKLNRYASDLFDTKEINYKIELPLKTINKSISMEKRQNLWLICKETITNIVKHSQCKNVNIKVIMDNQKLELIIEDDGIGFNNESKIYNNGIRNIKERAEALKAEYKLETSLGKGTKWFFSFRI